MRAVEASRLASCRTQKRCDDLRERGDQWAGPRRCQLSGEICQTSFHWSHEPLFMVQRGAPSMGRHRAEKTPAPGNTWAGGSVGLVVRK